MKKYILFVFLLISFELFSQNYYFVQTNGPRGGTTSSIISTDNGNLIANGNGGLFISMNGGNLWNHTGIADYFGIKVIKYSNGYLVSAGNQEIKHSSNNGQTWQYSIQWSSYKINDITKTPNGYLFTAASNGIYKSTNSGLNWSTAGLTNFDCNVIASNSSGTIFAMSNTALINRTYDYGQSWQSSGFGHYSVTSIAITSNDYIYLMTNANNGVYRSTDNGISYANLAFQTGGNSSGYLSVINGTDIYTGTVNGLFRSTNYGTNWIYLGLNQKGGVRGAFLHNNILFACTENGIWKSTNNGTNWIESNSGLVNNDITALAIDAQGNIFAGTKNNGLYCSTNQGNLWEYSGFSRHKISDFDVSGITIFMATTDTGIYKTSYDGNVWVKIRTEGANSIRVNSNNDIYICSETSGFYKSTNNGLNWLQIIINSSSPQCKDVAFKNTNTIFLVLKNSGIMRSTNGGINWTSINNGLISANAERISVRSDGTLFCTDQNRIYRSTNDGDNWLLVYGSQFNNNTRPQYNSSGGIFIGAGNGILYSKNNGTDWFTLSNGFSNAAVNCMSLTANDIIYLGTNCFGVLKSSTPVNNKNLIAEIPPDFLLGQNYPNPFNSVTKIKLQVASDKLKVTSEGDRSQKTGVRLRVYDLMGREVRTLVDERLEAGVYEVRFEAGDLPSGVYFYRMEAERFTETRKLILLK